MKFIAMVFAFLCAFALGACNSLYVKPNSLDTNKDFYADRGGYTMKRSIKEAMEKRGYKTRVGRLRTTHSDDDIETEMEVLPMKNAYVVRVKEQEADLQPIWCAFNGFWWWHFQVSIADQDTGEEVLSWNGRMCANSAIRKLNRILSQMEKQKEEK